MRSCIKDIVLNIHNFICRMDLDKERGYLHVMAKSYIYLKYYWTYVHTYLFLGLQYKCVFFCNFTVTYPILFESIVDLEYNI